MAQQEHKTAGNSYISFAPLTPLSPALHSWLLALGPEVLSALESLLTLYNRLYSNQLVCVSGVHRGCLFS